MFEGLVKRLLDTYLAPYVNGITQNLQLAVWSGNISLENLTLKNDIVSRLALPFHDVSGMIGSMNIRIPWASLGTTPIKIVIDSLFICIDNRSNEKTDAEILAHLRKKKNNLISILEHEYFELANLQSDGKLSSSYIIKLSQKILNNIQIDITNIHLQFFDEHSSFAFKIDSIFVRKSRGDESKKSLRLKTNDEYREEPVTHVCSLLGFSIYETCFKIDKSEVNCDRILKIIVGENSESENTQDDYTGLLMLEPLSFRLYLAINARNKSIYASLSIGSITTNNPRLSTKVMNYTNYIRTNLSHLTKSSRPSDDKNSPDSECRDDVSKDQKEHDEPEGDKLKIMLTSDVIRTFTKMWVDIIMDRNRGKRILSSKSNEVKLDPDSLKTTTKAEFIKLYTKYNLSSSDFGNKGKDMNSEERERLQDLIDLVPARYIARWKFACKKRSSDRVLTKDNKSWFKWAKNIVTTTYANYHSSKSNTTDSSNQETTLDQSPKSFRPSFFSISSNNNFTQPYDNNNVVNRGEDESNEKTDKGLGESEKVIIENLPGGLVLTEEEIKMIQETISLEELFEDSITTSSYYFECVLPCFQFVIHMLNSTDTNLPPGQEDVMVIDIQNLQSRLFMKAVMDMKDRDRYEGYFDLNLDSFDVILRDKKIMTFSQQTIPFQSIDTYTESVDQVFTPTEPVASVVNDKLELLQSISITQKCIMNLRVYHKITDSGNAVIVNGELRPIETNIFPELISVFFDLVSIFKPITQVLKEEFDTDGYNVSTGRMSIISGLGQNRPDDMEDDELLSCSNDSITYRETGPELATDSDKIQFINFDIKFSAPILILYYENSRIDLHFGTLLFKSNGDCPISRIDGTLELKQTQITCNYMDKSFNFLRPLPVKIHYDLDFKSEKINLNVIFEEIFAQLEPLATSMLFKIPNEIIKIVMKNVSQDSKPDRTNLAQIVDSPIQVDRLKQYKLFSNILIRHSGFSVSNLELHQIFKLDMYNVSIKMSNTHQNSNFNLSLESIIISNPTTKIPLFKTITSVPVGTNDDEIDISELNISQYPSKTFKDFDEEEYVDAIEDVSKSLDLEIVITIFENRVYNAVNIQIIEMEGTWEYSTIKSVVDGFQEYTDIFNNHINTTTFNTITTTFKTFKDKFIFPNSSLAQIKEDNECGPSRDEVKNIEGFLINEKLPELESEKKELDLITKCKLTIKGASVVFNNSNGDVIAKLCVGKIAQKFYEYQNHEKVIKLSIQTGKLYFGGRCVLSHLKSVNERDGVDLLVLNLKCYNTSDVPYSICFQGKVDRVVFVFFQHDINRFLEYFDDGILSVFLSKSYHRVVQRADEIYFFYHFSITSPIFILPENKAAIPNCTQYYKQTIPPGSTLPLYHPDQQVPEKTTESYDEADWISSELDMWYFGSYILFELGHLEFRNSYSKLFDNYKSTIFLKMLGTKAQIVEQKNGSENIKGVVLDPTDLKVCTRGRELMEIGIDSKALVTKLTRNQLTFLIDVFNENIGGASYMTKTTENNFTQNFPTKNESRYLLRLSLNKFQLYCYNNMNNVDVVPLGLFEFNDITCCLDYASNNVKLLSYYQFGFISRSLTVTDLRPNTFNKYKTLLKCNNPYDLNTDDLIVLEDEKGEINKSVNGLLFEWLRNYKAKTGNDFFKIDPNYFDDRSSELDDQSLENGIKCVVQADPEESSIDVIVSNSEIPLLFVYFFDLVRFFSLSYGTSSMSLFPKISQIDVERVYILNVLVSKSKFISFSKMDKLDCPRLELVTDFILQMHVHGNSFKFTKIDIVDCLLSRVYPNSNIKQVLCSNFLMYGKGHYLSDLSSKMFFQFTIPQINLLLYTRDLSIIIYCFKSMFTDGPSVIPVKLVNNEIIDDNSSKFLTLSFDIKGIEMMFYDDLKKSIVPLVKFTVESEKLEILNLPIEKRYSLIRCNCHLYYFNTNVGDWEPFIEKFIFNLEYITNPTSNTMDVVKQGRVSGDDVWKDFVGDYQLKISCNNNLLVNITPNLCQLLQYFLPILKSNLKSPYSDNPENTQYNRTDDIEMYNYRYVNLTNYEYHAFIMDLSKPRKDAFSEIENIVNTTEPKQLDGLVNKLNKEVSSSEYCIHLITRPPKYLVQHLSSEFRCSKEMVEQDLLTTSSVLRTSSNLSNITSQAGSINLSRDINSILFVNGMVMSNIPLSKNCTVLLSTPVKDLNLYQIPESTSYTSEPSQIDETEDILTNLTSITSSDLNNSVSSLNSIRTSSSHTLSRNNRLTNVFGEFRNNIVCEVLTPHPSHKLLLFTSTVRIYNKSGIPIILSFLDHNLNQQFVHNVNYRTIPCKLLDQNNTQNFEQYTSNDLHTLSTQGELVRLSDSEDGYYITVPNDYMLSVPENVFFNDSQCMFSFKPYCTPNSSNSNMERVVKSDYNKLVNKSGWSKFVDTFHHAGTRLRQCYCPELNKNGFLYFVVSVNNKRSSLPANVNISEVVIYPSISIMNTLPLDLDVKLLSKDYNLQNSKYGKKDTADKNEVLYTLSNKSILHIYSVPPNESLSLYIRLHDVDFNSTMDKNTQHNLPKQGKISSIERALPSEWCSRIDNIYGNNDTKSIINIFAKSSVLELELIRFPGALPVNNLCIQGHLSLIVNAPWLFIDRTGLSLVPQHYNRIYTTNNLSFLYDNSNSYKLVSLANPTPNNFRHSAPAPRHSTTHRADDFDESEYDIKMPIIGGYLYTTIDIKGKKHSVCLITEKVYIPGLSLITSKVTSALPEYLFTNNLSEVVYLRRDSRSQCMEIEPKRTRSISHLTTSAEFGKVDNFIEVKVGMETTWSSVVYLTETFSGENFMSFAKENSSKSIVYNITIITKNGIKYISINPVSSPTGLVLSQDNKMDTRGYLLYNNCNVIKLAMIRTFHKADVKNGSCFTAKYGQVVSYGWPNPFTHKTKLVQVLLWLDKDTVAPSKPLIFNFSNPSFRFSRIELTTPEYHTNHNISILAENRIDYYIISINAVNPVSVKPEAEEIDDKVLDVNDLKNDDMYICEEDESGIKSFQVVVQISQIGVSVVSQSLHEELFFLEMGGIVSLYMCKEDHQRVELKISDVQVDNQSDSEIGKTVLVNRSKVQSSDVNFVQIYIDRPFSNCKDISIKKMFISLDDLQVDFNDLLFTKVYNYYKECTIASQYTASPQYGLGCEADGGTRADRINIEVIERWLRLESDSATSSIDVNVKLPRSISIDYLYIESFNLVVWCCFELDKLHMLGDLLRMGLRILSVSKNFELMGAPLNFQREYITISRTSIRSFWEQMKEKYLQSCLSCIGSILGYSNLLNIPKLPLTVGKCTIELAADAVDSVSSGLGMVLSKFTFDKEYIKKRSSTKDVTGIKDGIFSAGKSIGEGLFSLTNIVTKPIEGAQKEGMGGFIKGLGKGLVGSIVKPIDKVGIAVSQVSRGIKANISKEERFVIEPCRKPRMLWGEFSQIRPYSSVDAEIKQMLGSKYSKYIMDCLVILRQVNNGKYISLLFYPSKIYLVDLINSHQRKF